MPPVALTIAGSDSGAGAGIQADLKTFAAHGAYGVCAITAITAQNTQGVLDVEVLSTRIVRAQIEAVAKDFDVRAAKTGMLAVATVVRAVAEAVRDLRIPNLVVDPVMLAKSGDALLDAEALDALRRHLLPLAMVVTPNLPEAEALADMAIRDEATASEAARRIAGLGPRAVIVKGGHAEGAEIVDLLYDGTSVQRFPQTRVPGTSTHGTGCTFAAALAAHLAHGRTLVDAVPLTQRYVAGAIRHAPGLGGGHGPMDHFWRADDGAPR
ncbi:MAG TPA: bifunctional hydroxymethylpyrimidine kinase/phosphomethylpyrimidine kinase [Vicinamibacterales bacterium]